MMSLLLNAPYWLIVILAVLGVVVLFSGLRRQQQGVRTTGLVMIAAAALLLVLRATVPTPEKKVERQARALMGAVGSNDWTRVGTYVSHAQFRFAEQSAPIWEGTEIATQGKRNAERYGLSGLKIGALEVKREPNVITVDISVTTYHKGMPVESVPSSWIFEYQERPEGWVLTNIQPRKIGWGDYSVSPNDVLSK
jgi:hypothetical protein